MRKKVLLFLSLLSFSFGQEVFKNEDLKLPSLRLLLESTKAIMEGIPPLSCPSIVFNSIQPPEDYAYGNLYPYAFAKIASSAQRNSGMLEGPASALAPPAQGMSIDLATLLYKAYQYNQLDVIKAYFAEITSGYPKPPPVDIASKAPYLCDFIIYYYPRRAFYPVPPLFLPAPTFPPKTGIADSWKTEQTHGLLRIRSEVAKYEYEYASAIINRLNAYPESFYGSVATYTFSISSEKVGREGKIAVDMQVLLNQYASLLYSLRQEGNSEGLRTLLYIFLTGFRHKGVKYPSDILQISLINLKGLSTIKLTYYPKHSLTGKDPIELWKVFNFTQMIPDVNPQILSFLRGDLFSESTPVSVLDQPVFLYMLTNHDFSQDTVFTDFVIALMQGRKPEVRYDKGLLEKLKDTIQSMLSRQIEEDKTVNNKAVIQKIKEKAKFRQQQIEEILSR